MLKRSLAFMLIGVMAFSATACGNKADKNKQSDAKNGSQISSIQSKNNSSQSKTKKETDKSFTDSNNNLKKSAEGKQNKESAKTQSENGKKDVGKN